MAALDPMRDITVNLKRKQDMQDSHTISPQQSEKRNRTLVRGVTLESQTAADRALVGEGRLESQATVGRALVGEDHLENRNAVGPQEGYSEKPNTPSDDSMNNFIENLNPTQIHLQQLYQNTINAMHMHMQQTYHNTMNPMKQYMEKEDAGVKTPVNEDNSIGKRMKTKTSDKFIESDKREISPHILVEDSTMDTTASGPVSSPSDSSPEKDKYDVTFENGE